MTRAPRLLPKHLFVISLLGGGAAALAAAVGSIIRSIRLESTSENFGSATPMVLAVFAFIISTPVFAIAMSLPVLIFNSLGAVNQRALFRWVFFPLVGAVIGFLLPFASGLLIGASPRTGSISGFFGGVVCAWAWARIRDPELRHVP